MGHLRVKAKKQGCNKAACTLGKKNQQSVKLLFSEVLTSDGASRNIAVKKIEKSTLHCLRWLYLICCGHCRDMYLQINCTKSKLLRSDFNHDSIGRQCWFSLIVKSQKQDFKLYLNIKKRKTCTVDYTISVFAVLGEIQKNNNRFIWGEFFSGAFCQLYPCVKHWGFSGIYLCSSVSTKVAGWVFWRSKFYLKMTEKS